MNSSGKSVRSMLHQNLKTRKKRLFATIVASISLLTLSGETREVAKSMDKLSSNTVQVSLISKQGLLQSNHEEKAKKSESITNSVYVIEEMYGDTIDGLADVITSTSTTSQTTTSLTTTTTTQTTQTTQTTAQSLDKLDSQNIVDNSQTQKNQATEEINSENSSNTEIQNDTTQTETNETIVETSTTELTITDCEYIMLCNVVAQEYGADYVDIPEKAKVVEVIMNRVYSESYPNTIYDVLTQPGQFSGINSYLTGEYFTSKVTDSVKSAVNYYFENTALFQDGYLSFSGDGYWNYFR